MENRIIETERLLIKPVTINHVTDKYINWLNDNETNQYLEIKEKQTIESVTEYVNNLIAKKVYFWAIHVKNDKNIHIGNIKIDPINYEEKTGEYGILIGDKDYWGQGFAKEASKAVLNFCFNNLNLNKITLGVVKNNIKAHILYTNLGFYETKIIEKYGFYNNELCDMIRMSIQNNSKKVILGTVQFGLKYGINNSIGQMDENEVKKILDFAYSNNINTLDTASLYGESEKRIGNYIIKHKTKHNFNVITKLDLKNYTPLESFNKSLQNLNLSKVETLMFHSFEDYKKTNQEDLNKLLEFKDTKFDKLGISLYTNDEIIEVIKNNLFQVVQIPFNLLDNKNLREDLLVQLKNHKKEIHVRSVFLQGLFFMDYNKLPLILEPLRKYLIQIDTIVKKYNIEKSQLAFHYVLSKNYIDKILIGVDFFEQFFNNIKMINNEIPKESIEEIDLIKVTEFELLNPSLWNQKK